MSVIVNNTALSKGVLKLAVSQNLISKYEGNILLRTMIQNGYYSPVSELDDIF